MNESNQSLENHDHHRKEAKEVWLRINDVRARARHLYHQKFENQYLWKLPSFLPLFVVFQNSKDDEAALSLKLVQA
jgi:hypothetical protein